MSGRLTGGSERPLLLAVPNVSEGRDRPTIDAIAAAFSRSARLLDVHADPDHGRSVFTLAGRQGELSAALLAGAGEVVQRVDLRRHRGLHPHVGALDVVPVVYLREEDRGAAWAEALTVAGLLGQELSVPVFLYGEMAISAGQRERAALREGGPRRLAERLRAGELRPDYGPAQAHPSAGAVLVTARPPLVAFNVDLRTDDAELARRIAARVRESDGGLAGVRAIGLFLPGRGRAQVSCNVHDCRAAPLHEIVEAVAREARAAGSEIAEAELVGLAPAYALEGFPADVPLRAFDPERHVIENALRSVRDGADAEATQE